MDAKHYKPSVSFRTQGIHIRDIIFDTTLQPKSKLMFLKALLAYKGNLDKGRRFQNLSLIASLDGGVDIPTAQKRIKPLVQQGYVYIEKRRHEASVYYLCPVFLTQNKLTRHRKKLSQGENAL